ncbi:uncharacterized protein LOC130430406 [Triplophysa dalaica]|uniref:uncharacterized protein LOC130430383 n=1 Tax=Triplophysa dalaica TaxID=1582913 RepID=UPI0024DFA1B2|nr:uncharacterized protein LOC130430383 [Triplophysa dalaica]XP_056615488.1 uncharacterized protein LOC130430406 [Triplophysa dalaica]
MFFMFVFLSLCFCCRGGVFTDEVKSVSVMEGDSVTLHTDPTDKQTDDLIVWKYGSQESLIAKLDRDANRVSIYDTVHDGMFGDRLQVDDQTGSLTIKNAKTEDSGLYNITVISKQKTSYTFSVTVYARLSIPVLTSYCAQNSSSVSKCVLSCSVMDVTHVSLSWYKGKSLLSSISVSEGSNIRSISLHLYVECPEDSYSCVLNNLITNQTQISRTNLNITDICHPCSDCRSCNGPECVIQLVMSAVVGLATVAVLVYEVRSNRIQTSLSDHH